MKLNNHGWGLREMLLLSAILIFFFGVSIYFIYVLYSSLEPTINNSSDDNNYEVYRTYEQVVSDAGKDYLDSVTSNFEERVINLSTLVDAELMTKIYDPETEKECNGYIKVIDVQDKNVVAYIKCDNYITEGY